jgi:ADP-heptose:LPS heptosyltransferase
MPSFKLNNKGILTKTPSKLNIAPTINASHVKPPKELQLIDDIKSNKKLRVAVARTQGGIGDVLMTFPAVKALKLKYDCDITYVTDYSYLFGVLPKLAQHCPDIDKVIPTEQYKEEDYHLNINLTCPCIAHEVPRAKPIHRIDLFARQCGFALGSIDPQIPYTCTEAELAWAENFYKSRGLDPNKTIIVQPYASNSRRSYDPRLLRDAISLASKELPDYRFIVILHDSDFEKDVSWQIDKTTPLKNQGITELIALIKSCGLVVCPDSSILHAAGIFGKKTIGLFGPTDPRARNYPGQIALCPAMEEKLLHWPCWYTCDYGHLTWNYFSPDMIASAIINAVGNRPATIRIESL